MRKFNWDEFKEVKFAVHCKTEEEAKDFCRQMYKHGMVWGSGNSYLSCTHYEKYKDKTCYDGQGLYQSYDHFKKYRYEILEWSDYMDKEFTKADLEIVRVYKIKCMGKISSIMEDHNLELIWEREKPKKMTVEEMRQKLEELTGEEIEVTA